MTKLQKITLCSLLLLMAVLVYVEATKPQPVNWFQSYSRADKIPFGTYVLHHLLTEKLGTQFIEQKLLVESLNLEKKRPHIREAG